MDTNPTPIDCDDALLLLAAADERTLGPAERAGLDAHIRGCGRCRALAGADDVEHTLTAAGDGGATGLPPMSPLDDRNANGILDSLETDEGADLRALPVIDPALYAWAETIGRGGMGRVMAARDRRLGRRVAIKELIARGLEHRFEREARITARLEHPAIVHVHEAGRWPSGELFYAMKLVEGAPLSALIRERDTLAARIGLLPNVMTVVDAIAYAHSQGVIHRDLKPSNIVVGAFGETVVIDWGLAKDLGDVGDEHGGAYRSGGDGATEGVLGTPQYMPPEQARGEPPDRRVDVYALGATLYHVLAGAAPYGGLRPGAVLAALADGPPPSIEMLQPAVPRDLAAIVAKAMARAPDDRYADAGALAADLRRFEAGQLVSASSYSTWSLVRRWLGRNRALVSAAALVLAFGAAGAAYSVDKILDERAAAKRARDVAVRERAAGLAELGRIELLGGDSQRAAAYLYDAYAQAPTARVGLLLGEALRSFDPLVFRHNAPTAVEAAAISPDGTMIAVAADGDVTAIRLADRRERKHRAGSEVVLDLAWGDDGKTVVFGGEDNDAVAWDVDWLGDTDVERDPFYGHGHAVRHVLPQPGGDVLTAGDDGTVRRWRPSGVHDAADYAVDDDGQVAAIDVGEVRYRAPRGRRLLALDPAGTRALIVPDGTAAAAAEDVPDAELVELATGTVVHAFTSEGPDVAALSSNLLAFSAGSAVTFVGLGVDPVSVEADAGAAVTRLAVSSDGRLVVAGDTSGRITLWDAATGAVRARVTGHRGAVTDVGLDRAAGQLVTGGDDGFVRVWDVAGLLSATPLTGSPDAPALVAVGGDAVAMAEDGAIVVARGDRRDRVPASVRARAIALTPAGDRLLVVDRGVELWDVATGWRLARVEGDISDVVVAPDGQTAATVEGNRVVLRDLLSLAPAATLTPPTELLGDRFVDHPARITSVHFAPGDRIVATARDGFRAWHLDADRRVRHTSIVEDLDPEHAVLAGDVLITGAADGRLQFRDAGQVGAVLAKHAHPAPITALAASRDGRVLASASSMIEVRHVAVRHDNGALDSDSADVLFTIPAERGAVGSLALDGDGSLLAVGDESGIVELWDVPTGVPLFRLPPRSSEIRTLAFTADGRWLVVAEASGPPHVWAVPREDRPIQRLAGDVGDHLSWVVLHGRLRPFRDVRSSYRRPLRAPGADATYDFSGVTIRASEPALPYPRMLQRLRLAMPVSSLKRSVRRTFRAYEHELRHCAKEVVREQPDVRGEIQLALFVGGDGRVVDTDLRPRPGDHGLAEISGCIDEAVRAWTFPKVPDAPAAIVYYPLRIEP